MKDFSSYLNEVLIVETEASVNAMGDGSNMADYSNPIMGGSRWREMENYLVEPHLYPMVKKLDSYVTEIDASSGLPDEVRSSMMDQLERNGFMMVQNRETNETTMLRHFKLLQLYRNDVV